jgi:hypothetical protein
MKPVLQWKSNKYYIFFCVYARMRVSVCAQARVHFRARARARVCVALLIQFETRMRHIYCHLWPLWFHHIFRQSLINGAIFGKKNCY